MASPVNPPRGMRDFLPAEKARRERVLGVIRNVYRSHGFDEIETPVVEDSARLHSGLGGDNEKLAFGILKRGLTSEDFAAASDALDLTDLGLRFDLTVPLARFYATHRAELPTVFRAIQIAPVWRAERPQKGRFRQFVQCDIDIIGEAGPLAEIELITATTAALDALGLEGCSIRINDRRILLGLLTHWNVPAELHERALITIDKLDKIGPEGVAAELAEHGIATEGLAAALGASGWDLLDDAPEWLDAEAYQALLDLRAAVPSAELVFDPTLVRGMGYYTGTIFEVAHPSLGYSLGGGGRYDGMIGRFLGTDVPATGFSLGFERLVDLVDLPAPEGADAVALLHDKDAPASQLVALKTALVAQGHRVRLERRPKNTKATLERLATEGFSRFAFVNAETDAATLELRPLA
ncbi:histidine--tRNA ligase [Salinibacterium sp. dk2585]|uniref:histidine--tRNA ligase n=1 Tax=unclassified Salinibacterium TaxID=2632331 RepID=UPI0011C242D7|nr:MULTISPECIES: histidine--tRNA ligase [unclassified Salinibacterium]QEE61949.1 histidine--tRNA ligase [Salinibacterium sp. dk2585]TXK54496.1 histidine--tRNA ligase [Salinibacterium sp. dk5596]